MHAKLLWVSESPVAKDKKQHELDYAARKSHAASNAHKKRRQLMLLNQKSTEITVGSSSNLDSATSSRLYSRQASGDETSREQYNWADETRFTAHHLDSKQFNLQMAGQTRRLSIQHSHTPFAAPWKGNSDPFDSQIVPVTPLLMKAVSFVRFYLSKNCSPSFTLQKSPNGVKESPTFFSGSLAAGWLWNLFVSDNGTFWSAVASVLPIMKQQIPEEEKQALQKMSLTLKAESFACLRRKLLGPTSGFEVSISVLYHVKTLFREACVNGDVKGAQYHAKVLCWLAERLPTSTEDVAVRRIALWSDATSALLHYRRPVLPYSLWMPRMISNIWCSAIPVLPNLELVDTKLSECILSNPLRSAFIHVRRALYVGGITTFGERADSFDRAELIFQWMITKAEYHICSLLNFYFGLNQQPHDDGLSNGERDMEAALALAMLYILQKSFCDVTRSDGIDMHESALIVHPLLTNRLRDAKRHCSRSEWTFYESAYLWMLSIGAHCETCPQLADRGQASRWFRDQLRDEANKMQLSNIAEAKSKLDLFIMNESLIPLSIL